MKSLLSFTFFASVQASFFVHSSHLGRINNSSHSALATGSSRFPQATDNTDCKTYVVKSGDTCTSIGQSTGTTWAQLLSWNSEINRECSNLASLTNKTICVSNPLGNYAMPTNTAGSGSSGGLVTTIAPAPTPTLDGTTPRCAEYHKVQAGETCSTIMEKFGISQSDFLFLNPEVNSNCTNLEKSVYYCVEPVGHISTYSGYGASSTKPFHKVPMTSVPAWVPRTNYTSGSYPVIPIANGTRKDCYDYIWLQEFEIKLSPMAANCWVLAISYEITPEVALFLPDPFLSGRLTPRYLFITRRYSDSDYKCKCDRSYESLRLSLYGLTKYILLRGYLVTYCQHLKAKASLVQIRVMGNDSVAQTAQRNATAFSAEY